MAHDKESYRKRREAGLRGQGDNPNKTPKVEPNVLATGAAQQLLDNAAILVKGIKGDQNPTHLEVYGMAAIILKDVYEEVLKGFNDKPAGARSSGEAVTDDGEGQASTSEEA